MRYWIAIALLWVVIPAAAIAKPKIAVAPFEGDAGNKVSEALAEALSGRAKVTGPREAARAMDKLELSRELDAREANKLRAKLGVAALVHGKLEKDGSKRTLRLKIAVRGKEPTGFSVQFKTAESDKFRESVAAEIDKRIGSVDGGDEVAKDDDPDGKRKDSDKDRDRDRDKDRRKDRDDDDRGRRKRTADRDDRDRDRDRDDRRRDRDDRDRDRDRDEDEDLDERGARKRDRRGPQIAARVDAGLSAGVRRLTYTASGAMAPPRVGTAAPGARIEGEIYPFALSDPRSSLAGLGLFAEYDKTFALSIQIPGTSTLVPIDQAHYAIGARYQLGVGAASSIGVGLAYARRHFIADRASLANPAALDAPDVDYTAISPGAVVRIPATPKVVVFAGAEVLLISSTGPIEQGTSYGRATVFGFEGNAGVDIALSPRFALRFAGELSQINFTFAGTGTMASARGVTAATDRSFGMAATLGVTY